MKNPIHPPARRTAQPPYMTRTEVAILIVLGLLLALAYLPRAQSQAPRWTSRDVQLETFACIHENDGAGGLGGTADCGAQIQVIENSRAQGESFSSALLRRMPRFAARTSARSWVWHLQPHMPVDPPGWPFQTHASRYEAVLHSVSRRVLAFMHSEEALPCAQEPTTWLGRETDGNVIAARLAAGWVEADCNRGTQRTREAYLYLPDVD